MSKLELPPRVTISRTLSGFRVMEDGDEEYLSVKEHEQLLREAKAESIELITLAGDTIAGCVGTITGLVEEIYKGHPYETIRERLFSVPIFNEIKETLAALEKHKREHLIAPHKSVEKFINTIGDQENRNKSGV